jgi:hypothetical protein
MHVVAVLVAFWLTTIYLPCTSQVNQTTDRMKRALAEMENVRTRTAREMDSAKKFAVQVGRARQGKGRAGCSSATEAQARCYTSCSSNSPAHQLCKTAAPPHCTVRPATG